MQKTYKFIKDNMTKKGKILSLGSGNIQELKELSKMGTQVLGIESFQLINIDDLRRKVKPEHIKELGNVDMIFNDFNYIINEKILPEKSFNSIVMSASWFGGRFRQY